MAERAVALERKDIYLDTLGYGYYLVGRHEEARSCSSKPWRPLPMMPSPRSAVI